MEWQRSAGGPPSRRAAGAAIVGWLASLALLLVLAAPGPLRAEDATTERFTSEELEPLLQSLEGEGFDRDDIADVFYDVRLRKLDRVVAINALNPDSADIYAQFTEPYAIHIARKFQRRHWQQLALVENAYGIPREYLVAILLVETQFGRAKLRYRLLEVLTTLAVEGQPDAVERHYERIRERNPGVERDWLATRLMEKAQFGYDELVAALSLFRDNLQHLYEVRGSYAGAIGMPQFLPSSYLRWAVDGDGDGEADLNDLDDALPSIANYLRAHGWDENADFRARWQAVWEYNHSTNYVRTIFEVAFRLSTPRKRR